ncbi:Phthalate 4,5-dioxygenase oxygenase subunit [Pigmentiphaga humi]|uniref:Phthalate 4,5-dioxygenase oxygenase subunit n=1 Tax=Pigmentiphaga humi TaxID=2478468 RepID=A0A3P4B6F7_9BURK|nr:Rieske 2Fe-2S domain-containing protein [Pigmentiphaga humi]VCU71877.1 Phthalate 4,5-dioxygenase oxygenase subunit [Pigmentiphaga humi]
MLSHTNNDLVTRTSADTPGGKLFRRYWQPVALSRELQAGTPLPVTLLGDALVLYRMDDGAPALMDRHCPHRGVDLSYARIEGKALRCLYHGWLLDHDGRCLDQPGEPSTSTQKDRIRQPAYPCFEAGGLVFAYLGEGAPPPRPDHAFFRADPGQLYVSKLFHSCNYLQGLEGYCDPQHLSYLHRFEREASPDPGATSLFSADSSPRIDLEETAYGLRIFSTRQFGDGSRYVRISNYLFPNGAAFDGDPVVDPARRIAARGYSLNWAVPIDDTHHWKYVVIFREDGPVDTAFLDRNFDEVGPDFKSSRNAANRYLQDRGTMDRCFAGMGHGFYNHDLYATESMGAIMDRTREHLGATDRVIIALRKQLLNNIRAQQEGQPPLAAGLDGEASPLADMIVHSTMLDTEASNQELVASALAKRRESIHA